MNNYIIGSASLLIPAFVVAEPTIDYSGYIGYKHIESSIDYAPSESFPEIGALLNLELDEQFSIYTQGNLSKTAIDESFEHALVYGFMSYTNNIFNSPYRISIGKLRHETGLYNSNIINPSTRPGVIEPQAIYWNSLSTTIRSGYGINVQVYLGDFELSYTIDEHISANEKKESLMWSGYDFLKMEPFFGSHQIINLNYIPSNYDFEIYTSFTKLYLNKELEGIEFISVGYSYDNSVYRFSAETLLLKTGDNEWDDLHQYRIGYSITLGMNLSENFEIHTNYNVYENSKISLVSPKISKSTDEWKDVSVGFTYSYDNIEFKTDIHKVWGGRVLESEAWATDSTKSWWYTGLSLVYHF